SCRQFEERRGVNISVDGPEFRDVFIFRMRPGKGDRGRVRGDRSAKISERIEWHSGSDEFRRIWIKDRIGRIQDAIESRDRYLLTGLDVFQLAVAITEVVSPVAIE